MHIFIIDYPCTILTSNTIWFINLIVMNKCIKLAHLVWVNATRGYNLFNLNKCIESWTNFY
jgi:hypothetical protein